MTSKIPARLKLPVRCVDGQWEFALGGAVPVRPGAEAELVIDASQIADTDFLLRVTKKVVVPFLPVGTTLAVALSPRSPEFDRMLSIPTLDRLDGPFAVASRHLPSTSTRFAMVTLAEPAELFANGPEPDATAGGLWLTVTGLWDCELNSPPVNFPKEYGLAPARSLNHAFTRLSEKFESHRISHTGNVFLRVFYCEHDGWWRPLRLLRERAVNRAENAILSSCWTAVEAAMGWCPWPRASGTHDG